MSNPTNPPTQQELLERQKLLLDRMEVDSGDFQKFLHGAAGETIMTDSGPIPTLAGLVEMVSQQSGARRYEIAYFAEDLTRYANGNEPLLRTLPSVAVVLHHAMVGSFFKLATPSSQKIQLTLTAGTDTFVIEFAANSTDGAVVSATITEPKVYDPGTMITLSLTSPSWTAKGLVVNILGFVQPPTPADA